MEKKEGQLELELFRPSPSFLEGQGGNVRAKSCRRAFTIERRLVDVISERRRLADAMLGGWGTWTFGGKEGRKEGRNRTDELTDLPFLFGSFFSFLFGSEIDYPGKIVSATALDSLFEISKERKSLRAQPFLSPSSPRSQNLQIQNAIDTSLSLPPSQIYTSSSVSPSPSPSPTALPLLPTLPSASAAMDVIQAPMDPKNPSCRRNMARLVPFDQNRMA